MEVSARPARMSALMPLLLALAACSGAAASHPRQARHRRRLHPPRLRPSLLPPAPSALFVLGDSLSDVGNAAAAADYVLNVPYSIRRPSVCAIRSTCWR